MKHFKFTLIFGVIISALFNLISSSVALSESIFLPYHSQSIYKKEITSLNDSEYWRIKIFGLRMAPLDPSVWGILKGDRTDNRRLVPIRPYFLRESEDPAFSLEHIKIKFSFEKVSPKEAVRVPFRRDALLDIEFAGRFKQGSTSQEPSDSSAYGVRLSAFPPMPSGLYYRLNSEIRIIKEFMPNQVESGRELEFTLSVRDKKAEAILNGVVQGEIHREDIGYGLISMQTGWHPLSISKLEVVGSKYYSTNHAERREFSGIINLPKKQPPKSGIKAAR